MTEASRYATLPPDGTAYPWNTGPSGQGAEECGWCGRFIYRPAVPCSVVPIAGLEDIETAPGLGERCKYEAATRRGN
ncbi:hypothetical protein M9980_07715 [Sphingomonas donggukensis]|uniref:Uncharacterized protein n=1 Tax=Sphingomonas donggukensis TaxID=2949093 RepID=A0ABY4TQ00_9SPHN|nr:hypothetical protein [Sphingomonas donggukensis]URW74474.1 hypothetical protein M9980_07715 [Sphingomonas donggukensis]